MTVQLKLRDDSVVESNAAPTESPSLVICPTYVRKRGTEERYFSATKFTLHHVPSGLAVGSASLQVVRVWAAVLARLDTLATWGAQKPFDTLMPPELHAALLSALY